MTTADAGPVKATPIRSLAEIAALAAYLIFVPPLVETLLANAGYSTTGLTRIVATAAMFAGLVGLAILLLRLRGETVRDLGLKRPPGILAPIVVGILVAAVLFAVLEELKRLGLMNEDRLGDMASELKGDLTLTFSRMGLSLIVVGFVEEFLFRGFVLDRLAKSLASTRGAYVFAVFGQAVLFGLAHAYQGTQGILFTGGVGLVFGAVFLAMGRNLWPVIVAHSLFDAARAAYLFYN